MTIKFLSILAEKGVEFVSLKENIDTTSPQDRFMLTVFGALAELERENILERTEKMIFHQTFHDWTKKEEKDFSLSAFIVQFSNFCCQRRLLFPAGGLHGVDHLFRLGKALHGIGISVVLQFHCGVEHEAAALEELRIL